MEPQLFETDVEPAFDAPPVLEEQPVPPPIRELVADTPLRLLQCEEEGDEFYQWLDSVQEHPGWENEWKSDQTLLMEAGEAKEVWKRIPLNYDGTSGKDNSGRGFLFHGLRDVHYCRRLKPQSFDERVRRWEVDVPTDVVIVGCPQGYRLGKPQVLDTDDLSPRSLRRCKKDMDLDDFYVLDIEGLPKEQQRAVLHDFDEDDLDDALDIEGLPKEQQRAVLCEFDEAVAVVDAKPKKGVKKKKRKVDEAFLEHEQMWCRDERWHADVQDSLSGDNAKHQKRMEDPLDFAEVPEDYDYDQSNDFRSPDGSINFAEQRIVVEVDESGVGKAMEKLTKEINEECKRDRKQVTKGAREYFDAHQLSADELSNITGTGLDGRILVKDVKAYLNSKYTRITNGWYIETARLESDGND